MDMRDRGGNAAREEQHVPSSSALKEKMRLLIAFAVVVIAFVLSGKAQHLDGLLVKFLGRETSNAMMPYVFWGVVLASPFTGVVAYRLMKPARRKTKVGAGR